MGTNWTRDDLPADYKLWTNLQEAHPGLKIVSGFPMSTILDWLVDHLNARHPKQSEWIGKSLLEQARTIAGLQDERDAAVARAETAEKRTAPAVTRADVQHALNNAVTWIGTEALKNAADAVWSLVSGADPAVHVVRESELPNVHPRYVRNFNLANGQTKFRDATRDEVAQAVDDVAHDLRYVIAAHRAIEAEDATDCAIEAKAQELWESTREGGAPVAAWADAHEDAQAQFRVLARHQIGE